jgi:transmembrane sensor
MRIMNAPENIDPLIYAQARDWFARILLSDDGTEVAGWEDWLQSHPTHEAAYDRIVQCWGMSSTAEIRFHVQDVQYNVGPLIVQPARFYSRKEPWAIAASLVVIVCSGLLASRLGSDPSAAPIALEIDHRALATAQGEHGDARLSDGSHIALGGATRLTVDLSRTKRSVSLSKGQVFVNVARDRARPFVVTTQFSTITAVGTAFDIDLRKNDLTLSVLHGTVFVDSIPGSRHRSAGSSRSIYVHAGQTLVAGGQGLYVLPGTASLGLKPSWISGRLEYRDVALGSVLQDVNRYSRNPIRLSDDGIVALRYTGSVDITHIDSWLEGLLQVFDLTAKETGGVTTLRKKNTVG